MTRRRSLVAVTLVALVICAVAACGASADHQGPVQTTASPKVALAGTAPVRVAVIVMENKEYGAIIGSPETPYINALAHHYALAKGMYATTHPSLPNYLALSGGSTFGISSDCTSCRVTASGLPEQLAAAHLSWKAYMQGLPYPCYRGASAGTYAKKHDPFIYYTGVSRNRSLCNHIVPLTELAAAERARTLPRFTWITPNLCDDMHDCAAGVGDRFLSSLVPGLLRALGPRGLLFVTWDEGVTDNGCCKLTSGGHIATIVAGGAARAGAEMTAPSDQYSILQTVEDLLRLRRLRGAACACTPSLAPLLEVAGGGG